VSLSRLFLPSYSCAWHLNVAASFAGTTLARPQKKQDPGTCLHTTIQTPVVDPILAIAAQRRELSSPSPTHLLPRSRKRIRERSTSCVPYFSVFHRVGATVTLRLFNSAPYQSKPQTSPPPTIQSIPVDIWSCRIRSLRP